MKTLGIVAHSAEGAALCFTTVCRVGGEHLGALMHPTIVLSAIPMRLSMSDGQTYDQPKFARFLSEGIQQVADAGADFFICPDNTAHIVLEKLAASFPVPGLHIADVVAKKIAAGGWHSVGLLGTVWTMTGPTYADALARHKLEQLIPERPMRERIDAAIFDELCQGIFNMQTTEMFLRAIRDLKARGAECVILGCTEIPLVVTQENSPLPILDSTRLLAQSAVREAINERPISCKTGWLPARS